MIKRINDIFTENPKGSYFALAAVGGALMDVHFVSLAIIFMFVGVVGFVGSFAMQLLQSMDERHQ